MYNNGQHKKLMEKERKINFNLHLYFDKFFELFDAFVGSISRVTSLSDSKIMIWLSDFDDFKRNFDFLILGLLKKQKI